MPEPRRAGAKQQPSQHPPVGRSATPTQRRVRHRWLRRLGCQGRLSRPSKCTCGGTRATVSAARLLTRSSNVDRGQRRRLRPHSKQRVNCLRDRAQRGDEVGNQGASAIGPCLVRSVGALVLRPSTAGLGLVESVG